MELDDHRLSDALFQAATLVHHAAYGANYSNTDSDCIRQKVESRVRLVDYFSRDIVNEAQNGLGASAKLGKALISRTNDRSRHGGGVPERAGHMGTICDLSKTSLVIDGPDQSEWRACVWLYDSEGHKACKRAATSSNVPSFVTL